MSLRDQAQQDKAIHGYRKHRGDLRRIAPDLKDLADLNLHDGQARGWHLTEAEFRCRLLIGDLQSGYQIAAVTHRKPSLLGVAPSVLSAAHLDTSPDAEPLSDEVDTRADGLFEHRFRFWPDLEFGVASSQVEVRLGVASSEDRRRGQPGRESCRSDRGMRALPMMTRMPLSRRTAAGNIAA